MTTVSKSELHSCCFALEQIWLRTAETENIPHLQRYERS